MARGFTIQQLAEMVGMTPRNIRAHQSRGLLQPPSVQGRVAYYDAHHVARLALVKALQLQGFSLESIRQIVEIPAVYAAMVQQGRPATSRWNLPATVPLGAGLDAMRALRPTLPDEMVELGLMERGGGDGYAVPPALAGLGGRLMRAGVPMDVVTFALMAVARAAAELGTEFAPRVRGLAPPEDVPANEALDPDQMLAVATQLFAAGFEIAFAHAAGVDLPGPA